MHHDGAKTSLHTATAFVLQAVDWRGQALDWGRANIGTGTNQSLKNRTPSLLEVPPYTDFIYFGGKNKNILLCNIYPQVISGYSF